MAEQVAPIQAIIDNDLCIACGACIPTCPKAAIAPAYSRYRGAQEVKILDHAACQGCAQPCGEVCPSIRAFPGHAAGGSRLGPIERVHIGHSAAFQHDGVSSSGGIIREICHHFLSQGISVICLTEERSERSRYEAGLLHQPSDLERMPGSIYHSVSFFDVFKILCANEGPFLLVTIPCHLEGLSKYIDQQQPELADRIAMTLGIICGWMYSDHALANFADAHGLAEPVLDAKYRGEDKVGKLKLRTPTRELSFDRRKFDTLRDMIAYRSSFSTDVNRLRCRLCQNHTNVQADISVGDAWLERTRDQKASIVVTRTRKGEATIEALQASGRVSLEPGSVADIEESQSKNLVYGTVARGLSRQLVRRHLPVVEYAFADSKPPRWPAAGVRLSVERARRALIRSERYRLYRTVYALTKPRSLLTFLLKRVV